MTLIAIYRERMERFHRIFLTYAQVRRFTELPFHPFHRRSEHLSRLNQEKTP